MLCSASWASMESLASRRVPSTPVYPMPSRIKKGTQSGYLCQSWSRHNSTQVGLDFRSDTTGMRHHTMVSIKLIYSACWFVGLLRAASVGIVMPAPRDSFWSFFHSRPCQERQFLPSLSFVRQHFLLSKSDKLHL